MIVQPSCPSHLSPRGQIIAWRGNKGGRIVTFVTFRGVTQDKITRIYNMVGTMHGGKI